MSAFVWLGVAAVMALVEALTFGLITMWFVLGALVAFAVNLAGVPDVAQVVVFLVVSVLCLVALRPVFASKRDAAKREEPTVIGQPAVVCEAIDNALMVGRVETPDHMTWAARAADGLPIPEGESVVVVGQESVKLIVERKLP